MRKSENQTDPVVYSVVSVVFIGLAIFMLAQPNYWANSVSNGQLQQIINLAWSVPGALVVGAAGLLLLLSSLLTRNE